MHLSNPLAMIIFALITLSHATTLLPTTITCTALSTSCEIACGPGYRSCGTSECYNPSLLESCCAPNSAHLPPSATPAHTNIVTAVPCPSGTFCDPEGHGCKAPTSLPAPRPNCSASLSGYSFSGTSSAMTSLTSPTNGTFTITSASKPGNLSLPVTTATVSSSNTTFPPPSLVSSISAGPVANFTYATAVPPTTGTVASPASTGAAERAWRRRSGVGVGLRVVVVGGAILVMGGLL